MIEQTLKEIEKANYKKYQIRRFLSDNFFQKIFHKSKFLTERFALRLFSLCVAFLLFTLAALAQQSSTPVVKPAPSPATAPPPSLEKRFFKNLVRDQGAIFTAPFRLRSKDAGWLAPFGATTAALIATDRRTAGALSDNAAQRRVSNTVSYFGSTYGTGAVAGGFYLYGRIKGDARARETGLLAAEALIDSGIWVAVLKTATQRTRPLEGDRRGRFFTGGDSFPSGHSAAAWSLATIVAHEYSDKPFIKYSAYGLATAVSVSRFTGRKHFLSDALVGSLIGYGIGRYVYRAHHDSSLDAGGAATKNNPTTKLFPFIVPRFDRARRSYGATLQWNF